MNIGNKQCSKCGRMLPYSEFHKNKDHRDGRQSHCKECVSKYHKERNDARKWGAMMALGGRCIHIENGIQCSKNVFTDLKELDLTHPHGNGKGHRDLISNGIGGQPFYEALNDRNYDTDGYVVEIRCIGHHNSLDRSGSKNPRWIKSNVSPTVLYHRKYREINREGEG